VAFSRHFFRAYNFAYTQCFGVVDDSSLRIHLLSFQIESRGMTVIRELADTRAIERADKATVKGLVELTDLDKKQSAERKEFLAILVSDVLIHEIAQLYARSVKSGKKDIGIFRDIEEALAWLQYSDKEAGKIRNFISRHRVKAPL